jgi:hypothetical protein
MEFRAKLAARTSGGVQPVIEGRGRNQSGIAELLSESYN